MFTKSSELYDLIYSTKDYKSEANILASILLSFNPNIKEILDAGCGTAEHHRFLLDRFQLEGFDLNEDFIKIAQSKNPEADYAVADMTNFNFEKQYDAVVCLFSSIGYVRTVTKLHLAISCFKKHLGENGVLAIEPWISPSDWNPGQTHMQTYSSEEMKVCRMTHTEIEDQLSILNFEYLVGNSDGIHKFSERHKLGLFDHDTMKNIFEQCGLNCEFIPHGLSGRGLYIGTHKKSD